MPRRSNKSSGFSLIELLVVIVVIGILASVALQSMTAAMQDIRRVKTEREMDMLAQAIVGDPALTRDNHRCDFGYVGDVGAFPPNLQALYTNPGGYGTWDGPYLPPDYTQDSTGFMLDEWGALYSYNGGLAVASTGSGSTITKKIADAADDYLLNTINGTILDAANEPPGVDFVDSIAIVITYPNGTGGTADKTYRPDPAGRFTLDSIPAGTHPLSIIYTPNIDTLQRYLTVLPRHKSRASYRFASAYFGSGGGGGGSGSYILRPVGTGAESNLTRSGCADNYACVAEDVADGDATTVYRASNSRRTDVYALEDPPATSGTITNVTVFCTTRREHTQGAVQPTLYIGGTEYNGTEHNLTTSYVDYNDSWATNPNTGAAWTWAEITDLQAGVRLRGQNSLFPAYCTQVRVVVDYTN